jgi:hypothetical protein
VLETETFAGPLLKAKGFVAESVVGHYPLEVDAEAWVVDDRNLERTRRAPVTRSSSPC